MKYLDPDGQEITPRFSEKFGNYDYLPRAGTIDTGNDVADYLIAGWASWWNFFAGCTAVLTNGIGTAFELEDALIGYLDDCIPYELTLTGNGFRADLNAIETISAANPMLISEIFSSVPEVLSYIQGCHSENEKIKYLSSLISNGEVNGRNIIYKLDDKTNLVFRRDFGADAHSINPKYPGKTNHYNIEIQKYSEKKHQFQTWKDYHLIIDNNNNVIDIYIKE